MKRLLFIGIILFLSADFANAQFEWSGSLETGFQLGGENSAFNKNGISNRYPNFSIYSAHLFFGTELNKDWSITGKLYYSQQVFGNSAKVDIPFMSANYDPVEHNFGFSIGRVVTPFGLFPKKQHPKDNISFIPPMIYQYTVNISNELGYWPLAGEVGQYGQDDVGLPTILYGGYQTGLKFYWFTENEGFLFEGLLSNGSTSSGYTLKNHGSVAFHSRIQLRPFIWSIIGFSAAYGGYMDETGNNAILKDINQYKQLTLGIDYTFAYSFFELSGEYIHSQWKAPKFIQGRFVSGANGQILNYTPSNSGLYTDLRIDLPWIPGFWIAGRGERIWFSKINGETGNWDSDYDRYTVSAGYLIDQGMVVRVSGFTQEVSSSVQPEPLDDGLSISLIIRF